MSLPAIAHDKPLYEVTLPIELNNGNDGRGSKWFRSDKLRKRYEAKLRQLGYTRKPFSEPVVVVVTRILGKRQQLWDSSSILRGNYKEIEDALVALGWFHDDSPKYIKHTFGFQDATQRKNGPAMLLQVYPWEGQSDA